MKSIKNIEKITKAMKMVASSRMRKAQTANENATNNVQPFFKLLGDHPSVDAQKILVIPICTDKGLCGGINTQVMKLTKTLVGLPEVSGQGKEVKVLGIGEKGRSACQREFADKLLYTYTGVFSKTVNFSQASELTDQIIKQEFEKIYLVYNHFASAISFKPTVATLLVPQKLRELEDVGQMLNLANQARNRYTTDELSCNLFEFQFSNLLMHALSDNNCSEFASRVQAMDNSSKNAGEILDKLSLVYNRTRQAAITTEIIEITSGAEALKG